MSAVVLWGLPLWLTRHPHVEGAERHTAIAATRVGIVAFLVALGAAITVKYTAQTFRLNAQTYRLTHTGQVTDRYTKAIGQLGDAATDVRIGAIYALERITKDSPEDQPTIMEVLTAYIREHAPRTDPVEPLPEAPARTLVKALVTYVRKPAPILPVSFNHELFTREDETPHEQPAADIVAALAVVARRTPHPDERTINLRGVHLPGANLTRAKLNGADLSHAWLSGASLLQAKLEGAWLAGANLSGAKLNAADVMVANLTRANLTRAILTGADLSWSTLPNVRR